MKYTKPSLSFEDQAKLLISRGLIVDSPQVLVNYLKQVNYYRLSGYWYSFKLIDLNNGDESFRPNTTFSMIRERYEFDRSLRLLLMDALEKIEVSIFRTRLVAEITMRNGCFGHALKKSYNPKFSQMSFDSLLLDIEEDENRSKEEFIIRYRSKYSEEKYLPFWMAAELMSYGQLFTVYKNADIKIKQGIAREFNIYPPVLDSWLHTLNYIRNACAHHTRLWNKPLPLAPMIPDYHHDTRWYKPIPINNSRIFIVLVIINYLLNTIQGGHNWNNSVQKLLTSYSQIPLREMGFPRGWENLELWK